MPTADSNNATAAEQIDLSWIARRPREQVLATDADALRLFAYIKSRYADCYFFESLSHPRHQDRYFSLGFDPFVVLTARGTRLTVRGRAAAVARLCGAADANASGSDAEVIYDVNNPYAFVAEQFAFAQMGKTHQGGLVGYFAHEAVNYFEPSLQLPEHAHFAPFKLGLYLDGLLLDTVTNTLTYYSYDEDRFALAQELLQESRAYQPPHALESVRFDGHSESKQEFMDAVAHTREKIQQGYSFQAEVGFKSNYHIRGDKFAIYNRLREINPSPYMFYVKFGDEELLGASPEILVSANQRRLLTTPTAGTTHRGSSEQEDITLARQLLADPKEIAEHNMLVDLHRNDLARVSVPGTVCVSDLMYIIRFSHVQHIVSNIVSIQARDKTAYDVLASIFPGGVVTGAPKIETIKIIAQNENTPRGAYGGAVGRFSLCGDCDFCLPIRSIFCYGDVCYVQTSAGVVYDSVPEREYREITNKLAAMKQTLDDLGGAT